MIIAIGTLTTWSPFNRVDRIKLFSFFLFSIGNIHTYKKCELKFSLK